MRALLSLLALTALVTASCQAAPVAPVASATPTGSAHRELKVGDRPVGIAAAGGFVYVSDQGKQAISVLDTAKNDELVKTLTFEGCTPGAMRAFIDRSAVLVLDAARGEVLVLDAGKQHDVLQRVPVGPNPVSLALAGDNLSALVGLGDSAGTVQLQFEADRKLPPKLTPLTPGRSGPLAGEPLIDLKGGYALIGALGAFSLVEVGQKKVTALGDTAAPGPVAFGVVDGKPTVTILADTANNQIILTDLAGGARTVLSNVGTSPRDIAVDNELKRAYVAMAGSGEVAVIDYVAKTLVTRLAVGSRPTSVQMAPPLPNEVWVGSEDGTLSVIDGAKATVKHQVPVGTGSHRFTFWGTKGYVTNDAAGSVTIIDRTAIR